MNDQGYLNISMMGDRAYRRHLILELNATRVLFARKPWIKGI